MIVASLCAAIFAQYDHLAWSDEFNGSALDLTKWTPQYGDGSQYGIPGWGNNEWQSYTDNPANLFVEDGRLHIVARQQNNQYTSARIRTLGNAEFTYGRMEARIKLPAAGQGLWPAFGCCPPTALTAVGRPEVRSTLWSGSMAWTWCTARCTTVPLGPTTNKLVVPSTRR